jgi:membrane fusion protein, multidrug efflux system
MSRALWGKIKSAMHARGLGCALGIALSLSTTGCDHGSAQAAPKPEAQRVPVTVAPVQVKTVPLSVRAVGNVQAYSTVAIRPQVTGQLESVHFQEGQEVKAGDLLFNLDSRPFEAALAQAKAALARDTVQAQNAAADAKRYASLVSKDYVTAQQADTARATAAAAAATVTSDEAQVKTAQLNLAYCTIRSPIAGRTGSLLVQPGNLVEAAGANPLVVIAQLQPIYVTFSVPEQDLAEIRARAADAMPVSVTPSGIEPELAQETGASVAGAQGKLTFIDNTVSASTGTIMLKAEFPNADELLWPGEFVDTVLTIGQRQGAMVVPSEAIENGQEGTYVYVVASNQTVQQRPVSVGATDARQAVIEKGLSEGESVVTDGQLRLVSGASVSIKANEKAAP